MIDSTDPRATSRQRRDWAPKIPRRITRPASPSRRPGFTLIELLVVITIILLISAVALPTVLPALAHRQVNEAARILQAVLAGARDSAIRDNAPAGIRLLPDPTFNGLNANGVLDPTQPLAYSRIIPIETAPQYSEGVLYTVTAAAAPLSFFSSTTPLTYPVPVADPNNGSTLYPFPSLSPSPNRFTGNVLMVAGVPNVPGTGEPMVPTSWFWNVRVGDKIQLNNAGPWYTIVGPMYVTPATGNSEMFVNVGYPGVPSPFQFPSIANPSEILFLVNGQDDNGNGWVDEGWDGVDNNGDGNIDELAEWENETWLGSLANQPFAGVFAYTIQRRPAPTINAREVSLPSSVVIDATSWGTSLERTRVPTAAFNQFSGAIDVLVNPDGSVVPTTLYSVPTSLLLGGAFYHFWLAERSDVFAPTANSVSAAYPPFLPLPYGCAPTAFNGAELKGEYRIVTLFTRTGQTTTNDNPPFDNPANIGTQNFNTSVPFVQAQQGVSGEQQ